MPVVLKKIGRKFCAVEPGGKAKPGRCHASRAAAVRQVQAINLSMRRSQGKKTPKKPK